MSSTAAVPEEPKLELGPLRIIALIKNKQQKHGLRHDNYQRYRGYCARRVERIRKSLKFTNQYRCLPKRPAKFMARTPTAELVGDIRYLEMVVFQMERNWAYAMERKFESMDEPLSRKKFGMRQKLRKAVKWADMLGSLVEDNELVQEATRMEAAAYCAFIRASLALELKRWKAAVTHFESARSGYAALYEEVKGSDIQEIYANKLREVENLLKLCRSESGDADVLLTTVGAMNLNESEVMDNNTGGGGAAGGGGQQRQTAMEVDESKAATPKKAARKGKARKVRGEPKPMKPFFFDLALNFVRKPTS